MNRPIAVILAGGRATRMNGQDKGLITFRNKTLVSLVIEQLKLQVTGIYISANRNIKEYEKFGYPVVEDIYPDFQGPLSGIASAFSAIQTDNPGTAQTVLVSPCDVPLLPPDLVQRFQAVSPGQERHQATCKVAHDGKHLQPLCSMLSTSLGDSLVEFFSSGQRAVKDWILDINPAIVDFSDTPQSFKNINSPDDLHWLEEYLT